MQLSWLIRGLQTGIVTTRYPRVAESLPVGFRGRPVLDPGRCSAADGCAACAAACLPEAITLQEPTDPDRGTRWTGRADSEEPGSVREIATTPARAAPTEGGEDPDGAHRFDRQIQVVLNYGACIMCGLCVTACPTGAITMARDYELAVGQPKDLVFVTNLALERGES